MISWPKLIGVCVVSSGIGVSFVALDPFLFLFNLDDHSPRYLWAFLVSFAGCVLFAALGYAVYTSHNWARRVLLFVAVFATICYLAFAILELTKQITSLGAIPREELVAFRVSCVGQALRLVTPPVFLVFLLCHRDIVRSFRRPENGDHLAKD
jgi:hypothetical protein